MYCIFRVSWFLRSGVTLRGNCSSLRAPCPIPILYGETMCKCGINGHIPNGRQQYFSHISERYISLASLTLIWPCDHTGESDATLRNTIKRIPRIPRELIKAYIPNQCKQTSWPMWPCLRHKIHIDGMAQDCGISVANALELPQSCRWKQSRPNANFCRHWLHRCLSQRQPQCASDDKVDVMFSVWR